MQEQSEPAEAAPSTIPAAKVGELMRLVSELLADDQVAKQAGRYAKVGMDMHDARNAALGVQAARLRNMLAGLLSDRAGGVTANGVEWACTHLRGELEREES